MKKLLFLGVILGLLLGKTSIAKADELPYTIKEGSIYYESSDNFGSGHHCIVNNKNPYTEQPCNVEICGYSYLDKNGHILKHGYTESGSEIQVPKQPAEAGCLMLHFKTELYVNGWTEAKNVIGFKFPSIETEEKTPEQVVGQIFDIQNDNKTAIVIDFSASMSDNQREVIKLLEQMDFNKNTIIIVFGFDFKIVSREDLINANFDVGGGTQMLPALNAAIENDVDNLILISDLATWDLYVNELKNSERLKRVVVYDPDDGPEDSIVENLFRDIWHKTEITRIKIK